MKKKNQNVWFQKVSTPPPPMEGHARSLEIPKGMGVLKSKCLEENFKV